MKHVFIVCILCVKVCVPYVIQAQTRVCRLPRVTCVLRYGSLDAHFVSCVVVVADSCRIFTRQPQSQSALLIQKIDPSLLANVQSCWFNIPIHTGTHTHTDLWHVSKAFDVLLWSLYLPRQSPQQWRGKSIFLWVYEHTPQDIWGLFFWCYQLKNNLKRQYHIWKDQFVSFIFLRLKFLFI